MKKINPLVYVGGGFLLIWLIVANPFDIDFLGATLPLGEYYSNDDCSFISNIDLSGSVRLSDYGTNGGWISVDWDDDGILEAFGKSAHTTSSSDYCSRREYIMDAPGGFRMVQWDGDEIAICNSMGTEEYRFKLGDDDAVNAILTCDGTTSSICGDGTCDSGETTSNCPEDCGTPSTGDVPGDTNNDGLIDWNEFINVAQAWVGE